MSFSKKDTPSNLKVKYILNKLNCFYQKEELFDDKGSVEYIIPETTGEETLNIGKLILLENNKNRESGEK